MVDAIIHFDIGKRFSTKDTWDKMSVNPSLI